MLVHARFARHIALLVVAASSAACSGNSPSRQSVTAVTLTKLEVQPSAADDLSVPAGFFFQFTAIGTYSDGTTADITAAVTWHSSSVSVATISNTPETSGLATTLAPGGTAITATDPASGMTSTVTLSVVSAIPDSLSVSPIDPTILVGTTLQLDAWATLSDGSIFYSTRSVGWSTSDGAVATVSATGLVTAVSLGSATITATEPVFGLTASTTVRVTSLPAVLSYLSLSRGSVIGGSSVQITGIIALTSPATTDVAVSLASDHPSVVTVPDSVVVPAGADRVTFPISTTAVTTRTKVLITATQSSDSETFTETASLNVRAPKR